MRIAQAQMNATLGDVVGDVQLVLRHPALKRKGLYFHPDILAWIRPRQRLPDQPQISSSAVRLLLEPALR